MATIEQYQALADKWIDEYLNTEEDKKLLKTVVEHYSKVYGFVYTNPQFKVQIILDPNYSYKFESGGDAISLRFQLHIVGDRDKQETVVATGQARFGLSCYPHCCAMLQLNGFDHTSNVTADQVDRFMQLCFRVYRYIHTNPYRRVIMNMVEITRQVYGDKRNDLMEEILPDEDAEIQYDHFYKWAKKQERVQDTLMRNPNTGRVIHHMEVIVNKS